MTGRYVFYSVLILGGAAIGAVARGALDGSADRASANPPSGAPADILANVRDLPVASEEDQTVINMLEALSLALTQEAEYRVVLEEQIDELSARIDTLQGQVREPQRGANARLSDEALKERMSARMQRGGPLTVERLTSAGMDEVTARSFKSKVDDIALQRLYLRDQAMREGWLGDQRYRDESRRLSQAQNGLRQDFGDEAYESYLYASGRPNRVQVQNVLENSPAFEAGMRAGDEILSYNGQRTFQTGELRSATQQGRSGEMIPVQIRRDGQTMDIYVPRGPLGVQMIGRSARPDD